jgi:hypothetical protein
MVSDSRQKYIKLALRRKPRFCYADGGNSDARAKTILSLAVSIDPVTM